MTLEPEQMMEVNTPEQELAIWVSGGDVSPSPIENIQLHLDAHMTQAQDLNVQGDPAILAKLTKHLSATYEMAQMQAMAAQAQQSGGKSEQGPPGASQSPVAGEQSMNAQTGRQAPSGATQGQMGGVQA